MALSQSAVINQWGKGGTSLCSTIATKTFGLCPEPVLGRCVWTHWNNYPMGEARLPNLYPSWICWPLIKYLQPWLTVIGYYAFIDWLLYEWHHIFTSYRSHSVLWICTTLCRKGHLSPLSCPPDRLRTLSHQSGSFSLLLRWLYCIRVIWPIHVAQDGRQRWAAAQKWVRLSLTC